MQDIRTLHEGFSRAMQFQEGLLEHVIGLRPVHREAAAETVQARREQGIQRVEDLLVADRIALHQ